MERPGRAQLGYPSSGKRQPLVLSLDKDYSGPLETARESPPASWLRQARGESPVLCEKGHCQAYRHSNLRRSAHCDHKKQLANSWNLQGGVFQVTIRRIGRPLLHPPSPLKPLANAHPTLCPLNQSNRLSEVFASLSHCVKES